MVGEMVSTGTAARAGVRGERLLSRPTLVVINQGLHLLAGLLTACAPVGYINTILLQTGRIQSTTEFVHPTRFERPECAPCLKTASKPGLRQSM